MRQERLFLLPPFADMSWMALMRKQNFFEKLDDGAGDTKVSKRMHKKIVWRKSENACAEVQTIRNAESDAIKPLLVWIVKVRISTVFVAFFWHGPWPGRKAKWMSNIMYSWRWKFVETVPADVRKKLVFHTSNMMIIRVECWWGKALEEL